MAGIRWVKTGKRINAEGTTITYSGAGTTLTIESRKRHIPHSNRAGFWDHTSYCVLLDGTELVEKYSLKDAKEYAEKIRQEE